MTGGASPRRAAFAAPPAGRPAPDSFRVAETGEVFATYEAYFARLLALRGPRPWVRSPERSGGAAPASAAPPPAAAPREHPGRAVLDTLLRRAVAMIQYNTASLNDVATELFDYFERNYADGEYVHVPRSDGSATAAATTATTTTTTPDAPATTTATTTTTTTTTPDAPATTTDEKDEQDDKETLMGPLGQVVSRDRTLKDVCYLVRLLDPVSFLPIPDTQPLSVPARLLRRAGRKHGKNAYRKLTREVAVKLATWQGAPWVLQNSIVRKFHVKKEVPKDVAAILEKHSLDSAQLKEAAGRMPDADVDTNPFLDPRRKGGPYVEFPGVRTGRGAPDKDNETSGTAKKRKIAAPDEGKPVEPRPRLRYPFEDLEVHRHYPKKGRLDTDKPELVLGFDLVPDAVALPNELIGDVLLVWNFIAIFGRPLKIFPPPFDDLVQALHRGTPTSIFGAIAGRLVHLACRDHNKRAADKRRAIASPLLDAAPAEESALLTQWAAWAQERYAWNMGWELAVTGFLLESGGGDAQDAVCAGILRKMLPADASGDAEMKKASTGRGGNASDADDDDDDDDDNDAQMADSDGDSDSDAPAKDEPAETGDEGDQEDDDEEEEEPQQQQPVQTGNDDTSDAYSDGELSSVPDSALDSDDDEADTSAQRRSTRRRKKRNEVEALLDHGTLMSHFSSSATSRPRATREERYAARQRNPRGGRGANKAETKREREHAARELKRASETEAYSHVFAKYEARFYGQLTLRERTWVLLRLVNEALDTDEVRAYLDECTEEANTFRRFRREIARDVKRFEREKTDLERAENAADAAAAASHSAAPSADVSVASDVDSDNDESSVDDISMQVSDVDSENEKSTGLLRHLSRREKLEMQQKRREEEEHRRSEEQQRKRAEDAEKRREMKQKADAFRKVENSLLALYNTDELLEQHIRHLTTRARMRPLGRDRHFNRYWWFDGGFEPARPAFESAGVAVADEVLALLRKRARKEVRGPAWGDGRLWVELVDGEFGECIGWGCYETTAQITKLLSWLDDRGIRERNLKAHISKHDDKLKEAMQQRIEGLEQRREKLATLRQRLEARSMTTRKMRDGEDADELEQLAGYRNKWA